MTKKTWVWLEVIIFHCMAVLFAGISVYKIVFENATTIWNYSMFCNAVLIWAITFFDLITGDNYDE